MSKINENTMSTNIISISKGSHWFGMIGRLYIFFAALIILSFVIGHFVSQDPIAQTLGTEAPTWSRFFQSIDCVIFGLLFLKARDGFEAICVLLKEMNEVV